MKVIYILPFLVFLATVAATAADGQVVYDVSGNRGHDGQNGQNAQIYRSDRGRDGQDGSAAGHGQPAGMVEAEIGFVPGSDGKEIYIKGRRRARAQDPFAPFEDRLPTSELKSILFLANGGAGGTGGSGGRGERGEFGRRGADRTLWDLNYGFSFHDRFNGYNGDDGQAGGYGGSGGPGGSGGSAGDLRVKLAPGAEILAPYIQLSAAPGASGQGGMRGEGGEGGKGGEGGRGICEDGSLPDFYSFGSPNKTKYDQNGQVVGTIQCGYRGQDGRNGQSGVSGSYGASGAPGGAGLAIYAYADGREVRGRYEIVARNWILQQEHEDGVIEPRERLDVRGLVIENRGSAPVPAAKYTVQVANGQATTIAVPELAPGAQRELVLDQAVRVEASESGGTSFTTRVGLDALRPNVRSPESLTVIQPVQITAKTNLDLTSRQREGELVFTVRNNSQRSYGSKGEIQRDLKIELNPVGRAAPLVEVEPGKFAPMDGQLSLDIPSLAAGETRQVRLKVRVPKDWKPGEEFSFDSRLRIAQAKVEPASAGKAKLAYSTDRNDPLAQRFSVKGLGVTCQYYKSLWFNYPVESVTVKKAENGQHVDVQVQLEDEKAGPVYRIALADVPDGFLDNVLREKPFTSNELVDFIQGLDLPGEKRSYWNVRSCYAAKNLRGSADMMTNLAYEAERLNGSRESGTEDGKVIQSAAPRKVDSPAESAVDAPAQGGRVLSGQ